VKDTVGYVYEKSAITHHIKASGGRAVCPVAGTSHTITLAEMRPAAAVIAAQRRAAGGKGQANKGKAPPIEL